MSFCGSCRFSRQFILKTISWSDTKFNYSTKDINKYSPSTTCSTSPASHVNYIWLFAHLYVYPLLYHYICRERTHQYQIWMASACQGFGVPSVMLLPAGRGRAEEKQNRTSSDLSGEQPLSSFLPLGENEPKEALALPPFIPPLLPSPCSALPGTCSPFEYSSFPLRHWISHGCHLAWSQTLTATCFPQTSGNSSSLTSTSLNSYCVWKQKWINNKNHIITL